MQGGSVDLNLRATISYDFPRLFPSNDPLIGVVLNFKGAANSRMMPRSPGRLAPSNSRRALNDLRNEANANIASYEVTMIDLMYF